MFNTIVRLFVCLLKILQTIVLYFFKPSKIQEFPCFIKFDVFKMGILTYFNCTHILNKMRYQNHYKSVKSYNLILNLKTQ